MAVHKFSYDDNHFLLDGRPFPIHSGELHYFRVPQQYWRDRLLKAKALGLNTICTYMPWNLHEPKPGLFDFTGMLDVAAFAKAVDEAGLFLIVRPGPYICAEWDFGGLPAWLLAEPDIRIRCCDERYLAAVRRYIDRVAAELAHLTCTRGGPITLVQVENEYGNYGNDKAYLRALREMLRDGGFDVPLFTSDDSAPERLHAGTLEDTLAVVNFGSKAEHNIGRFRAVRPKGPAMCGEFWCGWFDQWGKPRNGSSSPECAKEVEWMVDNNVSFNLYMFHGGTNFGFTSGANFYESYAPTVTGYDYWAPLDEAGRPTQKYFAIRDVLASRLPDGKVLPDVPAPTKFIEIPGIELTESVALRDALPAPVRSPQPRSMESLGLYHAGVVVYRTRIDGLGGGKLIADARDFAVVFLNGEKVGTLRRDLKQDSLEIPAVDGPAQLDIVVYPLGRVNFGPRSLDRKGIPQRVELGVFTLMDWEIYPVPLENDYLASLRYSTDEVSNGPAFHRGTFELDETGDTFLDLRNWRKGTVWVNGHNLGRFWHIGPQQTLYCPGVWLKPGRNEIVVFDLEASGRHDVAGLKDPILNEPELKERRQTRVGVTPPPVPVAF